MRPLHLEIAGLRSFRAKQSLDFTDLSLFAVIGDTGAGKSSILEAIVFALYAGSTWDARGGGALMSLDADTMSVVFDFSVGDKRYRVKRIVFRSTRPSEHALTSPDDPECRCQGERQVNAEIRRLVGLDYDTFKKTVVLPQGRFAALLEMSDTDRSKVLTDLLGLDEIDRLREKLEPARQEAGGRKRDALVKRGELGTDPAAEAARREKAERAAHASLEAMTRARDELRAKTAERKRLAERASALEMVERESAALVTSAGAVRALVPEHERLQAERTSLAEKAMQSRDELAAASAELHALETQRRDAASVASFAGDVKRLRDDAAALCAEAADLETRERSLQEEEAALQSAREVLEVLRAKASAAQNAFHEAERRREDLRERGSQARDAWGAWTRACGALESARAESAALDAQVREQTDRRSTLEAAVVSAETAYTAARSVFDTAERANRAAALAHELHAGEPCPVCRRELPEGFAAPAASGIAAAKRGCDKAERDRDYARTACANGRATLSASEQRRAACEVTVVTKAREREAAENALAAAGLTLSGAGEAEALEPLRTQYKLATAEVDAAQACRDAEKSALATADAELKARSKAQVGAYKAHRSGLQAHAKRVDQREAVRRGLPEPYRPAEAAELPAFERILAAIETARTHAVAVASKQAKLATDAAGIEGACRKADAAYQQTVADASVSRRHELDRCLDAVASSLQTCGLMPPPVRAGDAFDALVSWCEALLAWCERTRGDAALRRAASSDEGDALDAALAAILRAHEVENAEAFEGRFVARTAEVTVAEERLRAARENARRAAALDRELLELEPIVNALERLNRYLQNRAFKDFVMRRRERRLLGLGSEILRGMTGERYAFAEGFEILDRHADRVRSAKTLSGGETFLASLALALALVEVASRTGGRLDALFLDEGFGNLDASALDDALSELADRAKGGKMIGIVTHVRGIAEQIDTILRVERRATGSVIERLEGAALAEFMEDEVRTGLLQGAQTI